jgi:integrase
MPRQRMRPGEHGRIAVATRDGRHYAWTRVRDSDGKLRRVERSSDKSAEDARRLLQRHLRDRRAPVEGGQAVNDKTTLADLFALWIAAKTAEDGISAQSADSYRQVWRVHGGDQLGALRITELSTSAASSYLLGMGATTQAKRLRMILSGMFGLAVRFGVLAVNPIRETKTTHTARRPPRAATPAEFTRIRAAVSEYSNRLRPGPRDGVSRLLPAFVECLAATGVRPNEVLAIEWRDVDLLADPPTVTVTGTLIDHGRIAGQPLHRQDKRKHGAPPHTVVLPRFGVDAFTALVADTGGLSGPVFVNRDGGWVSLANMRRALRAALPDELSWVTPHSFRRTVATVVRDAHGPAAAQQQLSHAKPATTEAHYLQRQTSGPDVRETLDRYAAGDGSDEGMCQESVN